ncbi:MAG: MipA/OmpV family protein [Fusobacterium perfoetens]|uniref:MipA/OmpV family protein n=1 Tax=Fusobacterium perfoetens TaxID=852 RepID=UPI0023F2EF7A|nr:MipA/OmpV family protein [Fusobacterium perfoetens]MCI6152837.1 MipA/OmpV family protein [Fusobacterium perfoetens]MDY3237247.1 MipA/OmpV family protein [Fusobacterium perfoetens]
MKKTFLILGIGAILAQGAYANSIGLGYGVTSKVFKSDEPHYVLPFVDIEYNGFFIDGGKPYGFAFGYNLIEEDNYSFSIYAVPFGGYKIEAKDMDAGYKGIDDRDTQFMGGAEFSYTFIPFEVTSSVALEYGKEGGNIHLKLNKPFYINSQFTLVPSFNYTYYNNKMVDYYFGVDSHETKYNRPESYNIHGAYDGKAGYTCGIGLLGNYQFTESFSTVGFVGITKLSKELADSPLAHDDVVTAVGGGIIYSF